uniref:OsmC family peroxiredoxin n=1 Tax=Candidatus Methanomethylicus mesodigestus TaxID=1867258 RepID=A0A7C3J4T3_9CREN
MVFNMPHATVKWVGNRKFVGGDRLGHEHIMEAHRNYGGLGEGTTPMDMFLIALGGCAGIDIVTMLEARGQAIKRFEVAIDGKRREQHPRFFSKISLKFTLGGDLKEDVVDHVISLTMRKVCPIAGILSQISDMDWSFEIVPA